ncbi:hypothetical protein CPB84DRAFT_1813237 [Gymnopilus junonius]|uniref:Uncharacterized protein n=1 Tax=Gymnopilus junonius TaxID=109634 RepID=A0A9P5NTX3_GYMJU|nr:hypothetical protein CPB84DRAFT_1813237 [Gymnopilus junonius]
MGFFSSRKAEDNDNYLVPLGTNEKGSVVQVIRSRFYGKKGKEREDQYVGGVSAAQPPHISVASSPVSTPARRQAGSSTHRAYNDRPLPATPSTATRRTSLKPPPSPLSKDTLGSSSYTQAEGVSSAQSPPRKNTDTVTVTLAQRLNELAAANSEGLLNDDEYRILRQNLFERFASNAAVPVESPVVPVTPVRPRPRKGGTSTDRPTSRPLSNFQVETRPASISSKTSATSGVANLLRRATGRKSGSNDLGSDTASVWSSTSRNSIFRLPRTLSKKSSDTSVRTTASRNAQADTISISSRRPGSDIGHGELPSPKPKSIAGSIRRMGAPPSSFHNRALAQDTRNTNGIYNVFDEDHLTTVKEITQEIMNVEAEAKRLMDAFNGLEVTTLAKAQRHHVRPSLRSVDYGKESSWGVDSDIAGSLARSAYSTKKLARAKSTLSASVLTHSRPGSLHRKDSATSVSSEVKHGRTSIVPPLPALPNSISHGHLRAASNSNVSLVRSTGHLPMNTVPEDDKASPPDTMRMESEELDTEMEDIRRRREEVSERYEARLEYLRAKLKGAQLHEKLLRK